MGTWAMAHAYPDLFAAIAPVCGIDRLHVPKLDPSLSMQERRKLVAEHAAANPLTAEDMAPLANTPTYIFEGQRDPVVPVSGSLAPYAALREAGNTKVRMAIYPQTDLKEDENGNAMGAHDSWTQTYEWAGLYEWMLEHSLDTSAKL
jgi:predicted peptidase